MQANFRPQLRQHVQRVRDPGEPHLGYLIDGLRQHPEPIQMPLAEFQWVQWFDGKRTLRDIQTAAVRQLGDNALPLERLFDLTCRLDDALLLEGPRWQQHIERPVREPVCIGCYDGDAEVLGQQLEDFFTGPAGPGLPQPSQRDGQLRAALIPHIDYARGGVSYAWGFKEVFERSDASLFVIVGTSHYSRQHFTLTRKDFKTPLGAVPTDRAFIDRLVRHYGSGLFDDEHFQAHLPEHSIELEVVFLQWFYGRRRPVRIVPLVVGSFHDATLMCQGPAELEDIGRMVEALRRAEAETLEPICYLISGDLAHLGPKFHGGQPPITAKDLAHSRRQDGDLLEQLENADAMGFFNILAAGESTHGRFADFRRPLRSWTPSNRDAAKCCITTGMFIPGDLKASALRA